MDKLKELYEEDITITEEMIDKQSIALPKIIAKYQFFYNDLLKQLADEKDREDKQYHEMFLEYKKGLGELGVYSLNTTEIKKLLETSLSFRDIRKSISKLEADLKTVEDMISNIKNIGYSINNYLTYKKILIG